MIEFAIALIGLSLYGVGIVAYLRQFSRPYEQEPVPVPAILEGAITTSTDWRGMV